uniref:Uncharacterized protein n=1 Tax=Avena sativa TaxID=4498 RepID=A0ACD5Y4Z2_AVESA
MASKTGARSQKDFSQQLSRALSELCVITLLHVAAAASYAATRLARVSKLKAPCTVCSRMDHALHGKPWISSDLICAAHRSEISSIAYCKSHGNLAHSDDLCKRCLAACAAPDEVNSRSRSTKSRRLCSCCSEPFTNTKKLSEAANVVESSHIVHASDREETHRRSQQVAATDKNNLAMPPKAVPEKVPADHSKEKAFVVGTEEVGESDGSPGTYEQSTKDSSTSSVNVGSTTKAAPSAIPSRIFLDRNSSMKNTFIGRVNLPSPRPSEIISARDNNSTTQQEVKAFITQMSCARGIDFSWTEGAPSSDTNVQNDEINGAGSRRPSLERNYSVLDPSDANLDAGEAEGEITPESLKRQIELNRNAMAALYKEIDEERSASAVATSQAMAMINRLHEEKAAMQMEALQYLRMMEEQADHDHQAIQNLHDLLTEREKELLDMDSELDNCRRLLQHEQFSGGLQHEQFSGGKFDDTMGGKFDDTMGGKFDDMMGGKFDDTMGGKFDDTMGGKFDDTMGGKFDDTMGGKFDDMMGGKFDDTMDSTGGYDRDVPFDALNGSSLSFDVLHGSDFVTTTMSGFEEEKAYILESLGRLEEKLRIPTDRLASDDDPKNSQEDRLSGDQTGDESTSAQQSVEENHKDECSCSPLDSSDKMSNTTSLKDEFLLLDTRVRALEDDHEFLKRVLSSLKGSTDGLQCVREITGHLQELRRVALNEEKHVLS